MTRELDVFGDEPWIATYPQAQERELPTQVIARFAGAGMTIFPVDMRPGPDQKRPGYGYLWKQRATSDLRAAVDDFVEAEQRIGTEFVGIAWALGLDGYVANDLDGAEPEWWDQLGETAVNVTKRGKHLIFKQPPGRRIGNGESKFPSQGWGEVRGSGGYIIIWWPGDRPGFDVAELEKVAVFPHPEWLTDAGDEADAVSPAVLEEFKAAHTTGSLGPIKGYKTLLAARVPGSSRNLHACTVACMIAREAAAGVVPAPEAFAALEDWWTELGKVVENDTEGRPKTRKLTSREIRGVERWAVGQLTPERVAGGPGEGRHRPRRLAQGRGGTDRCHGRWHAARRRLDRGAERLGIGHQRGGVRIRPVRCVSPTGGSRRRRAVGAG